MSVQTQVVPREEAVNSNPINATVIETGVTATEIVGVTENRTVAATVILTDHPATSPFWSRSGAATMSYGLAILALVSRA